MSNEYNLIKAGANIKNIEKKQSCGYEEIKYELEKIAGIENIKYCEPLKNHTSFKVGGPADIFITPRNVSHVIDIVEVCKSHGVPFFIMGNGTNLIVRDKGIRGVVIKIGEYLNNYHVDGEVIEAEAGILLSDLSKIACENSLTGLEFACGIPGTLGGAIVMNAGAYGGEMKDVVISTHYLNNEGELKVAVGDEHLFGYRTSFIQKKGGIVLKTKLKLRIGDKELIRQQMDILNEKRAKSQPLEMPSAGSVFKRPPGYFTGPLIEQCGLKGYSIGGAQVSTKHCGFIVNKGNASASDIIALIKFVQDKVKAEFGVHLEPEIKIVGEE
ncbi:MAG TPA: UDP-N-acetylmuramate dehydrogenase [Clostridiaceae bacterium]|nr:UDP-N-acetylmuramate dehydrogenase [Clostridiaceae bacterium]